VGVNPFPFKLTTASADAGDESCQALEILLGDHVRDRGMGDIGGSIFVLDRSGVIRYKHLRGEELAEAVMELLDEVPAESTPAGR
jgi:hypothetical protein